MTEGAKSPPVLEGRGLTRRFSGFTAVDAVDITVREGTIHALIGPNGAGKTTCFNLLTGFLPLSEGRILFRGRDVTGMKPAAIARLGLVRSFQISAVFADMTCLENVRLGLQRRRGVSHRFWRPESDLAHLDGEAVRLLGEVGLAPMAHRRAGALSYGRKRALEIAATLALSPDVLLLDEPMAGMAHEDVDRIADLIRRVAVGRTVLMVEHNLSVVAKLCDAVTVLQRGRVLAEGDYATVAADPEVRRAYMGSAAEAA